MNYKIDEAWRRLMDGDAVLSTVRVIVNQEGNLSQEQIQSIKENLDELLELLDVISEDTGYFEPAVDVLRRFLKIAEEALQFRDLPFRNLLEEVVQKIRKYLKDHTPYGFELSELSELSSVPKTVSEIKALYHKLVRQKMEQLKRKNIMDGLNQLVNETIEKGQLNENYLDAQLKKLLGWSDYDVYNSWVLQSVQKLQKELKQRREESLSEKEIKADVQRAANLLIARYWRGKARREILGRLIK